LIERKLAFNYVIIKSGQLEVDAKP